MNLHTSNFRLIFTNFGAAQDLFPELLRLVFLPCHVSLVGDLCH